MLARGTIAQLLLNKRCSTWSLIFSKVCGSCPHNAKVRQPLGALYLSFSSSSGILPINCTLPGLVLSMLFHKDESQPTLFFIANGEQFLIVYLNTKNCTGELACNKTINSCNTSYHKFLNWFDKQSMYTCLPVIACGAECLVITGS